MPRCDAVDAAFVLPVPEAQRDAALGLLGQAPATPLDDGQAASLAGVPFADNGGPLAAQRLAAETKRLEGLKTTPAWSTWNASRLAVLQAIGRTGAGGRPFLVRGVAKSPYSSASARFCGGRLEVLHSSMGHDTPPSRRAPIIVLLPTAPQQVDVRWRLVG